jgi:hypothetical protein
MTDVVVDMDALAVALGSPDAHEHPTNIRDVAGAVRRTLVSSALAGHIPAGQVWVIETFPTPESVAQYLRAGAVFLTIDPGEEVCQDRAEERGASRETRQVITNWYAHRPDVPGKVVE